MDEVDDDDDDEIPAFLRKQTESFDEEDSRRLNARRNLSVQDGKRKRDKVFPSALAAKPVFRGQTNARDICSVDADVSSLEPSTVPSILLNDSATKLPLTDVIHFNPN